MRFFCISDNMTATDDFSSNSSSTGVISPATQANGTFETAGDIDWFRITAAAGMFYRLDMSGTASDSHLMLYDGAGVFVQHLWYSQDSSGIYTAFEGGAGGDYFIAAEQFGPGATPQAYTIQASAPIADDVAIGGKTGAIDQAITGTFEFPGDTDRYLVTLAAGKTYTVTTNAASAMLPPIKEVGIWLGGDAVAGASPSAMPKGTMSFVAPANGEYVIQVQGIDSGINIPYQFTVTLAADDYQANVAGAGALSAGAKVTGQFEVPNDRDWFGTPMVAGTEYVFQLQAGEHGLLLYDTAMRLLDASGKPVATPLFSETYFNNVRTLTYRPEQSGTYYAEVISSRNAPGEYIISAAVNAPDDHGNRAADATSFPAGATPRGVVNSQQDNDYFKFAVQAGHTYAFELDSEGPYIPWQHPLTLLGTSSTSNLTSQLSTYTKSGAAQYGVLTASYTGDYYLIVNSQFFRPDAPPKYILSAQEISADDVGNDRISAGELQAGGKVSGKINYLGDADWYKIQLQPGVSYALMLRGEGSGEGSLPVMGTGRGLQLYDANGNNVQFRFSTTDGMRIIQEGAGGEYYVAVQNTELSESVPNATYTLHLQAVSNDSTAPTVVAPPAPATPLGLFDDIALTFSEPIGQLAFGDILLQDAWGSQVNGHVTFTGNGYVFNPVGHLNPGATYTLQLPLGIIDAAGNPYDGKTALTYTTRSVDATPGAGNDLLAGPGNNARIDGGAGRDTVIYDQVLGAAKMTCSGAEIHVQTQEWAGADILTNVERLLFRDAAVAYDSNGAGGQAYRLYQASFNRAPDLEGIGYWIAQLDKGTSLYDVAQSFLNSDEFRTLYGAAPSNADFVDKLYQNVLHRAGDQPGIDYWNGVLASGVPRSAVLTTFSESPENQAAVLKVIGNGFAYTPYG
jgi:hypothetical protein